MAEPSGVGTLPYYLKVEYTTFEIDADDWMEFCAVNPHCVCLETPGSGSGSGSGEPSGSGGGGTTGDCLPDENGNICIPAWFIPGIGCINVNDPNLAPVQFIAYQAWVAYCQANGGGGSGSGGGGLPGPPGGQPIPSLIVEYTTFEVPDSMQAVSKRCVDVPLCGC